MTASLWKEANGRFCIDDDKQLKKWKEHYTIVLDYIASGGVPPLVQEMASHNNMRIRTASPDSVK